jgi:hypothetical protein
MVSAGAPRREPTLPPLCRKRGKRRDLRGAISASQATCCAAGDESPWSLPMTLHAEDRTHQTPGGSDRRACSLPWR